MPQVFPPRQKIQHAAKLKQLLQPGDLLLTATPPLAPGGNKPLTMDFEQQLKALILFHFEEHASGRHLLQALETDDLIRQDYWPDQEKYLFRGRQPPRT